MTVGVGRYGAVGVLRMKNPPPEQSDNIFSGLSASKSFTALVAPGQSDEPKSSQTMIPPGDMRS